MCEKLIFSDDGGGGRDYDGYSYGDGGADGSEDSSGGDGCGESCHGCGGGNESEHNFTLKCHNWYKKNQVKNNSTKSIKMILEFFVSLQNVFPLQIWFEST